jgi:hypothetical protein
MATTPISNELVSGRGEADTSPIKSWGDNHYFDAANLVLSLAALVVAAITLGYAIVQLRPLRRTLDEISRTQRRVRRLKKAVRAPRTAVTVRGFDPRFDNADWKRLIGPHLRGGATLKMDLSDRYREFYRWYERRNETDKSEVLIVDLLLVPQLLKEGRITPLHDLLPLQKLMSEREEVHDTTRKKGVGELAEYLCTDVNGTLGALPIWINTHGRFLPEGGYVRHIEPPVAAETSFHGLLGHSQAAKLFESAGVQTSYLGFEFWAHMAYRGCRPFYAKPRPLPDGAPAPAGFGGELTCNLVNSTSEWWAFRLALADLATRLHFSSLTRERFMQAKSPSDFEAGSAFGVGHLNEARMIRSGVASWKPVCSSELLRKALPRREEEIAHQLSDETCFKPPYVASHGSNHRYTYLSAVGGYGLALPAEAASNRHARTALKFMFLVNPCLYHPYLVEMIEDCQMGVPEFAERHARPRVPFWNDLERALNRLIFNLLLEVNGPTAAHTPKAFWDSALQRFAVASVTAPHLETFIATVMDAASDNGWDFDYGFSPKPL